MMRKIILFILVLGSCSVTFAKRIATGGDHNLVIKADGSLWAWGNNYYGQLGNGESGSEKGHASPVKILDSVAQVAAGENYTLAITTEGSLWAWGVNNYGQLGNGDSGYGKKQTFPVKIMDGVTQVAAGLHHTLVIKNDGSLWAWGSNSNGQLGDGTTEKKTTPVKIMDGVVHVAAGDYHTLAIKTDGSLWAWGHNYYLGILVDGTDSRTVSPVNIYKGVVEVDAYSINTLFLTSDGDIFAFGDNTYGQLGSEITDSNKPVKVPLNDIAINIATGGNTSFAITDSNNLYGWGADGNCEIGDKDRKSKTLPMLVGAFTQIAIGSGTNSIALKDTILWEWGSNCSDPGYLRSKPTKTQTGYISISAGYKRIFGIKGDHSLWAWGDNSNGCLGTGNIDFQKDPVKIMEDVAQVVAGDNHTLAIKIDGSFWAWGDNYEGQLGNGQSGMGKRELSPVKIMEGVSQAATGTYYSLALKTDGSLWFWGNDEWIIPEKIMDDVNQIAGGDKHFFAIKTDGSLWAWGDNYYGQLGNGESGSEKRQYPPIKILDGVTKVAAGTKHTLAIKSDGSLWAWGSNSHGQLGQGTKNYSETPVFIMNSGTQKTITEYAVDGVKYLLRSDKTAQVKTITADRVDLVIPSTITYDSIHYDVTALGDSIFYNDISNYYIYSVTFPASIKEVSEKTFWWYGPSAIVWKSNVALPANSFNNLSYIIQNFLLYVNSENIAPSGIKNLVVNGTAEEIVLKNEYVFNCPQEFTAKKISYTHNYNMETGYKECAGWETIALPFDVQTITHATKGELTPFASWISGSNSKPFWLYSLSSNGFVKASKIEANTPYLISMPNHSSYSSSYNVCGEVTFSATNSKVYRTGDDYQKSTTYDGAEFWPCYSAYSKSSNLYALNVTNDFFTYSGGEKPGSTFISNYRQIYPFEARFWKKTTNTRSIVIKFADDNTTDMKNILKNENKIDKIAIYTLGGTLVKCTNKHEFDQIWKGLSKGVYIVNGEKWIK